MLFSFLIRPQWCGAKHNASESELQVPVSSEENTLPRMETNFRVSLSMRMRCGANATANMEHMCANAVWCEFDVFDLSFS